MYNMHQRQEKFDYLFTEKILDFIEAHSYILKPILGMLLFSFLYLSHRILSCMVGKSDMRTRLARALREHRESFESLMARSGQYKLKRMTYDDTQPRSNFYTITQGTARATLKTFAPATTPASTTAPVVPAAVVPAPTSESSPPKLPSLSAVVRMSQDSTPKVRESRQLFPSPALDENLYLVMLVCDKLCLISRRVDLSCTMTLCRGGHPTFGHG